MPLIYFFFVGILLSQSPDELLENGNSELQNGNLTLAEDLFNQALKIDPSFAPALKSLSKLYLHMGNLKKANEYSIEAVQKDEDFREWSNVIAKISENIQNGNRNVQQGLFEEAMKYYELIAKDYKKKQSLFMIALTNPKKALDKICDIGNELNISVTKEEVIEYLSTIDDEATKMWLIKARGGL